MEKKIKGFYFSQVEEKGLGPRKKIEGHLRAFAKAGIEMELVESPFCLTGKIRGNFFLRQLVSRLPFTYVYSKHTYYEKFKDADVYYIRFLAGDSYFIKFLKKLRQNNPKAKIVMELPDYPTTWYMTTSFLYKILYFPIIIKDMIARKKYQEYVDRIAMLKNKECVFGIPVIRFENGIDMSNVRRREVEANNVIKIIAVAAMCNFHGYDRLIEGMHEYYLKGGTREVELHFVGGTDAPGNELGKYKALCLEHNLMNNVFFYGEKTGKDLDAIYDKCNLAIASLGMYRIGYKTANSLKIREYLAKGLPVITGCETDIFKKTAFPYYCEFVNSDIPIEIEKVIWFFDSVYKESKDFQAVNEQIRDYAEQNCSMQVCLKPVIEYLL